MTIGTNIPGMYDYTLQKQKQKQASPTPFNPSGPTAPIPTTTPAPGPQQPPPMGGYIDAKANTLLQPKPPAPTGWSPYRPPVSNTPAAPVPPQVASPAVQAPATTPAAQPVTTTPTPAAAAPTTFPKPQPAPAAGAPGSTLQDPGQITEAGKAYAARVTQNLQGNNPIVQNAQATEDTAAARRAYTARRDTQESLAQTPFGAGSAQYQRAMDQSQAGVNAANQAGQAGVNQVTRQATADALTAANNLEDQQYGRAVGERTDARTQAMDLANSITDPKAKYAFNAAVAAGVDPKVAYQQIVGSTGTINAQYRGQSPVETVRQDATDWIKNTTALKEGTPEFNDAVTQRMKDLDATKNAPVQDAKDTADQKAIEEKIRSGAPLTDAEQASAIKKGTIPQSTFATVPKGSNVTEWLKSNPSGLINVDGNVYKVVAGGTTGTGAGTFSNQVRHTDWVEVVEAKTGKTKYIVNPYNNDGSSHGYSKEKAGIYDSPPERPDGVGDWTPFGF